MHAPTLSRRALISLALLPVAARVVAAYPAFSSAYRELEKRIPAPNVVFKDSQGKSTTLDDFRGRLLIVNLWATWCPPCVKELPSIARLSAKLPAEQFKVLAISQDRSPPSTVNGYLSRNRIEGVPVYFEMQGSLSRHLAVRGMPTTFLVDARGDVFGRLEGPTEWDEAAVISYLIDYAGRRLN